MTKITSQAAWKNITGIFITFTLVFGPHVGILSLQSSINNDQGLGLATAAITYVARGLALPLIPVIYSIIGSKYSIVIGYVATIVYAGCNFYPTWYTLVPGATIMGMGLCLMFANSFTHTSETASLYASSLGKNYEHTVTLFLAIYSAAIKGGSILGSLVSSSVLFNLDYNETTTDIEDSNNSSQSQCNNMGAEYVEKDYLYYILMGMYVMLCVVGIALTLFMLDNFTVDSKLRSSVSFKGQIVNLVQLFQLFGSYKILLMFPLFLVNGLAFGFISGSFAKVFISDCIGVEMVGFVTSVFSLVSLVSGLLFGWLRRYVSAFVFILMAVTISEGLTLFLLFWSREPSYYAVFGFAIGWGICDGVWQSVVSGIVGLVFSEEKTAASTIFVFGISIGYVITFVSGIVFSVSTHLWIIFSIVLYAGISYTALVIIMKINDIMLSRRKENNVTSSESKELIKDNGTSYSYGSIKVVSEESKT